MYLLPADHYHRDKLLRPSPRERNKCTRVKEHHSYEEWINLLTPNVKYSGRTTPLTSKVAFYIFIQQM